jgi:uncharacterized protein YcfL
MKKIGFAVILLGLLVLGGCVGTTALGVLDDSVPEASRCPLELRNNLAVITYDNQPVEWAPELTSNKTTISLPPGEHSFIVRYYVTTGSGSFRVTYTRTATINQEFLPGHSYRIYRSNIWLIFVTLTSIKCKDVTPKNVA